MSSSSTTNAGYQSVEDRLEALVKKHLELEEDLNSMKVSLHQSQDSSEKKILEEKKVKLEKRLKDNASAQTKLRWENSQTAFLSLLIFVNGMLIAEYLGIVQFTRKIFS